MADVEGEEPIVDNSCNAANYEPMKPLSRSRRTRTAGAEVKTIDDLGKQFCRQLEEFFINYHKLEGPQYMISGLKGPPQAQKLVKARKQ